MNTVHVYLKPRVATHEDLKSREVTSGGGKYPVERCRVHSLYGYEVNGINENRQPYYQFLHEFDEPPVEALPLIDFVTLMDCPPLHQSRRPGIYKHEHAEAVVKVDQGRMTIEIKGKTFADVKELYLQILDGTAVPVRLFGGPQKEFSAADEDKVVEAIRKAKEELAQGLVARDREIEELTRRLDLHARVIGDLRVELERQKYDAAGWTVSLLREQAPFWTRWARKFGEWRSERALKRNPQLMEDRREKLHMDELRLQARFAELRNFEKELS